MLNSFLLIGQSNMAGRGQIGDVEPIDNNEIYMFRDGEWATAKEPLHTDPLGLAGIGLGMSFADALQKKYHKPIGLIPCAVGGSSLSQWQKGETLYVNALEQASQALKSSNLKGILWHQGETDSDQLASAQTYRNRFLVFIDSLQEDLGISKTPIILGELGEFLQQYEECTYYETINDVLKEITNTHSLFSFVPSTGLTHKGDFLHFDSCSLREFGSRFAHVWEIASQRLGVSLD
ncbi:sialate O-acetylesterase [Mesobacillus selenatarsenatis]|uniref:Acetylxylan esterase related enzyme n=1 Tax=Mesobacillus selenatarsenatis (strain DSM 18680 / JCM 14380 / FERM P-15431 / SF-1) TaxID=1321606 RepID=A0A0A8X8L1_MESS1|nr:sialate O-acetylesterase [Mesobacillus selenatarsenatis]GAM16258.1 acetylxylan esterase related enzyme [Mesobacillus selenatarsenatis SF-1]